MVVASHLAFYFVADGGPRERRATELMYGEILMSKEAFGSCSHAQCPLLSRVSFMGDIALHINVGWLAGILYVF